MWLLLSVSTIVWADWAPTIVQDSLKRLYPTAEDVAWTRDFEYYVADFLLGGFGTKVWFDANGNWVMKQTDWETLDEAPGAIFNAFSMSNFSDDEVEDVTWVQFPHWQSMVVLKVGIPNMESAYQLFYTPGGRLLRTRNVTYQYNILGASTFL